MSVVGVVLVFQSAGVDHRLVIAGAVVPLVEGVIGHPWLLHTLLGAATVLGATILSTRRHRLLRRRVLGLPIGLFAHLVLDAAWTRSRLFWWPFLGKSFGIEQVPELSRGLFGLVLEIAGLVAIGWCWRRFRLDVPENRRCFFTTGRLEA